MRDLPFAEWIDENKNNHCFFIIQFVGPYKAAIIKFNRRFAFGLIDLTILQDIVAMLLKDLNESWEPVESIQAKYVRTEINSEYLGIVPKKIKCRGVRYKLMSTIDLGEFEILYPYSTLFPLRNKLYK